MKKGWIAIVFASFLIIPIPHSSSIAELPTASVIPAQLASERLYGDLVVEELYQAITTSELRNIVQKFTENGSRFLNDGYEANIDGPNRDARNYIIQQLEWLTSSTIEIEVFGDYFNVIGKLPGYLPGDNPVFIVTAHYDSPESCPGANCNGGGIAAMLVLAKVMSLYEWPLDIYFISETTKHC